MNMLLHGIGAADAPSPSTVDDALRSDPGDRFDMVLTNPRRQEVLGHRRNAEGEVQRESLTIVRDDFWATTSNKQLNLLQHVKTLAEDRRTGSDRRARQRTLRGRRGPKRSGVGCSTTTTCIRCCGCDRHFYAQGVKANVLFFDRQAPSETPWTRGPLDL